MSKIGNYILDIEQKFISLHYKISALNAELKKTHDELTQLNARYKHLNPFEYDQIA